MNREAQIFFVKRRAHEVASWAAPSTEDGYAMVDIFVESATADLERLADDSEMREIYTAAVLSWFRDIAHKAHTTRELRQAVRKVFGR